jgi:hypothetical protein
LYPQLLTEVSKFSGSEVCAIISDDAIGYSKAKNNGFDEIDHRGGILTGDRHCLNPLGELVDCD